MSTSLQARIEALWDARDTLTSATQGPAREAVEAALEMLDRGDARVAEPTAHGWHVNQWLKQAVLLSFRLTGSARFLAPSRAAPPVSRRMPC